jgi:hypothetical protein
VNKICIIVNTSIHIPYRQTAFQEVLDIHRASKCTNPPEAGFGFCDIAVFYVYTYLFNIMFVRNTFC